MLGTFKKMKMVAPTTSVLILVFCFFVLGEGNFITDLFNPGLGKSPRFTGSQLYLISSVVDLDIVDGYVGCFGDFNSDKYTDLFVISGNASNTVVDVYLWDHLQWKFTNSSAFVASPYITNIAAGDFNHDGKLDLLVSGLNTTTNTTYVSIYSGDLTSFSSVPISTIEAGAQVSILDSNNDLKLDLFGELPPVGNTSSAGQRVFWTNTGDGAFAVNNDNFSSPLRIPHSNAFVDIDGDCLADRFVTSLDANGNPQYELWINAKTEGYKLHSVVPLPPGAGQVTFADFDRDGNLDFLFPVCYPQPSCSQENSIYVVFNQQKKMCSLLQNGPSCRSSTNLCSADSNFLLGNISTVGHSSDPLVMVIPTTNFTTGRFYFDNELGRPLTIRVGDYNLDGYPDLLIPMVNPNGSSHVELWKNTGKRSGFALVDDNSVNDLVSIPNAYAAAFFDFDEDGILDLLVLADNPPRIEAIFNNYENDAFFVKALGLNGVCPEWCPTSPKFPSPKPYGVNYVGAVFKFTYTDLSGSPIIETGSQLPQSAYLALQTPYIMFGLGRTSNYIEQFFFGVALNQTTHYNYWTGSTIPNSQLVAIPYKPENAAGWTLELYITPSGLLFWIMIALVGSLVVLSIFVCVFYRKEKKEDELQKQQEAHLFSFDAL